MYQIFCDKMDVREAGSKGNCLNYLPSPKSMIAGLTAILHHQWSCLLAQVFSTEWALEHWGCIVRLNRRGLGMRKRVALQTHDLQKIMENSFKMSTVSKHFDCW